MSRRCIGWLAVFCLASAAPTSAQSASGAFTAKPEGSISPKVAAAYLVRDQFNPRESRIEVILSTAAVDVAKAVADVSPHMVVILKAALSPAASERFVKSYNDDKENLTDMLDTLNFWLPVKDATITGGKLMGDVAVLDVEGVLASGVKVLTLVRLIRRPSGWLFDSATMAGMLP